MSPSLAHAPTVPFNLSTPTPCITKVGIVGNGEVVHQRLVPALQSIGLPRDGLVVCSLEPQSGLTGLPHQYYQVGPECLLPLDGLFVETCRHDPAILRQMRHIEGVFYEMAGIRHGRQQKDGIIDVQWHLCTTALIAPFKAAASQAPFDVTVDEVQVAAHASDPHGRYGVPPVWTASQIQGRLVWDGPEVTYDHR